MKQENSKKTITTFVFSDANGNLIDDFENISENTEIRAIAIEPENNL